MRRLVLASALVLTACSGGGMSEGDQAAAACEEFVKSRLKAPSTASFSGVDAIPEGTANGWEASGSVDAENSFGASIRADFTCHMHTEGDEWVLESIQGLD